MADVDVTEFVYLEPDILALVGKGANGFPQLVAKGAAEEVSAVEAAEALVAKAVEMWCGDDGCAVCKAIEAIMEPEYAAKAKLKAKERNALPDSDFALPGRRYPIHDINHARNALSRVATNGTPEEKAKVRAAVHKRYPEIESEDDDGKAAKSPGVPNGGIPDLRDNGHAGSTPPPATSGHQPAVGTSGMGQPATKACPTCRGVGYLDPLKPGIACPNTQCNGSGFVATEDALVSTAPKAASVAKDGGIGILQNPTAADAPGSALWESFDATSLASIAQILVQVERAVDRMALRERVEAVAGQASDWADSFDLESAQDMVQCALGIVARLAFHEEAEGVAKCMMASEQEAEEVYKAIDKLSHTVGRTAKSSEEDTIMAEVTGDELAKMIQDGATAAVKDAIPGIVAGVTEAMAAEAAKASAESGGGDAKTDTASGDRDSRIPRGEPDADVEGEVLTQTNAEMGAAATGGAAKTAEEQLADVTKQLEDMRAETAAVKQQMEAFGNRPRSGGPNLPGQSVGPAFPGSPAAAAQGDPTAYGDFSVLEKALADAQSPQERDAAAYQLSYAKLRGAHEAGLIPTPGLS